MIHQIVFRAVYLFAGNTKVFNEVSSFLHGELLQQDLFALQDLSKKKASFIPPDKI